MESLHYSPYAAYSVHAFQVAAEMILTLKKVLTFEEEYARAMKIAAAILLSQESTAKLLPSSPGSTRVEFRTLRGKLWQGDHHQLQSSFSWQSSYYILPPK